MSRYVGIQEDCAASSIAVSKYPENIKESDKYLFKNIYQLHIHETKHYKYNNVKLNSDLIHIHNGELFTGVGAFLRILKSKRFIAKLIFIRRRIAALGLFKRKCINIDKAILITEQWSYEYAHWICESLSRLFSIVDNLADVTLLLPAKYKEYSYIAHLLGLFDVKVIYFESSDSLSIKELLIPHYLLPSGCFDKNLMCGMSKFIQEKVGDSKNHKVIKRLYISRQHAKQRKVSNEDEVIELVKKYGFEVLVTEKIPYKEVLAIYKNVNMLVTLHGAGLTNMLFMPPGCRILELRRQGDAHNNYFYSLSDILGHYYYYQECKSKYNNPITLCADVIVDIGELEENIKLMLE